MRAVTLRLGGGRDGVAIYLCRTIHRILPFQVESDLDISVMTKRGRCGHRDYDHNHMPTWNPTTVKAMVVLVKQ